VSASRSWCSYDQDSDAYSVTVKEPERQVTCYRAPGSYIRERFNWGLPLNGDALALAIQATALALGA
jgi:hypothetical protein